MDPFHALSEPTRRRIIEILAGEGHLTATEICDRFPVSPQAISQHLKVLREARLVTVEKRAQQRIYRVNPEAMLEIEAWTRRLRRLWDQRLDSLDALLQSEQDQSIGDRNAKDI